MGEMKGRVGNSPLQPSVIANRLIPWVDCANAMHLSLCRYLVGPISEQARLNSVSTSFSQANLCLIMGKR